MHWVINVNIPPQVQKRRYNLHAIELTLRYDCQGYCDDHRRQGEHPEVCEKLSRPICDRAHPISEEVGLDAKPSLCSGAQGEECSETCETQAVECQEFDSLKERAEIDYC
jgi:hypothetical protein